MDPRRQFTSARSSGRSFDLDPVQPSFPASDEFEGPSASRVSLPYAPRHHRRHSLTPRTQMNNIDDASRFKVMIKYLYSKLSANQWLPTEESNPTYTSGGVLIRRARGEYVAQPEEIDPIFVAAITRINAEVAFTMATETTNAIFSILHPRQTEVILPRGSQLQVIDSLAEIVGSGRIKKFQYAALIREEQVLLIWHDDLDKILTHAASVEEMLLALIWGTGASPFSVSNTGMSTPFAATRHPSAANTPTGSLYAFPMDNTKDPTTEVVDVPFPDQEKGVAPESLARPLVFTSNIFVGLAMFLILVMLLGFGVSNIVFECMTDHYWPRLALLATEPFFLVLSTFFAIVLFTDIFQAFGPVTSLKSNSRHYSAIKPDLSQAYSMGFSPPHITIQMPVYKESLEGVIMPTVASLKAAISHYESHGGTASILVNDDGLANLSEEEIIARLNFYHDNNIGWVSRPKHGDDGFLRKGKFKKASNMNFALNISNKVEDLLCRTMSEILSSEKEVSAHREEVIYKECLARVLRENPRAKADGHIRIGEHILLVDSDTRVPVDCLLYGAAELFLSPEVAIIQHSTGVMQVQNDYFENGITYFTNLIYTSVRFAVASGESAAFVGHNAFIRWEALQSIGVPEEDGYVAFWSESHVSEDFDVALRLQCSRNVIRMAAYHNDEFKEGVSLTIYDELARWEKYAYGCNELVFNPVFTWLWRGPFTRQFWKFLFSNIQLSSKITIIGYISTYYALAIGLVLTVLNYFLIGWFNGWLDKFYLESWKVFLSLLVVFSLFGNITLAILRYRLSEKSLLGSLVENFKWMPMFAIFFGGMPFHIGLAMLSHAFGINKQWGATSKEKQDSNFFKEVPKIFREFWAMYAFVITFAGGMIYLGVWAPRGWEINSVVAVVPMAVTLVCHALVPFVLNPSIMVFNY